MSKFIIINSFILLFATFAFAQLGRGKVVEGNRLFEEEKYDQALNKYRDAQVYSPESPLLKFNIADAQYKKNKYEEALKEFESALTTDDATAQAKTYYNLGNTLYRMGKLPESILAYKESLKINPDDEDAKYNLEFVRRQLKDQSEKQQQNQQQQNQQDQQQQNQQQQQQNQDQQEQQEQQEQEQQQQQQEQEQQEQEQQEQQQSKPSEEEQQNEEQQQQQEQQMQPTEELSEEDAERILQALKEDEENMKNARKQKVQGNVGVLKDW